MLTFIWSVGLFVLALGIHIGIWRVRLPKLQTQTLALIFATVLACALAAMAVAAVQGARAVPATPIAYCQIAFLYSCLTLAYLATYPTIEIDSPSLRMVLLVAAADTEGLDRQRLVSSLTDEVLIDPRLNDLIESKAAEKNGDIVKATPLGQALNRVFIVSRGLLGLGKGG